MNAISCIILGISVQLHCLQSSDAATQTTQMCAYLPTTIFEGGKLCTNNDVFFFRMSETS